MAPPVTYKGPKEDSQVISNRKNVFARFAQVTVRDEEQRRLRTLKEEPSSDYPFNSWSTESQQALNINEQLAYAQPFRAAYEVTDTVIEDQGPSVVTEETSNTGTEAGQPPDSSSSLISENDEVCSLPKSSRRGRAWQKRSILSGSTRVSSIADFELTSTVFPPSEMPEFSSNLDISELRKDFFFNYKTNTQLPISSQRGYLIHTISSYSVVILEGATGCGKTTQIPIYILEDAILNKTTGKAPVVYVTQPRKIAARSIATRVCDEHGWQLGSLVGYQVGLDKVVGPQTILVYCTAGVLLQKLIQDKSLANYTHIVIDEAHERDADTDLLLMMIRALMRKESSFFRLVIMSATMDLSKLKHYFTFKTISGHKSLTIPSIVKVEGREPKPIQIVYYDKLSSTFQIDTKIPDFDKDIPELHDECLEAAKKIILNVIPHLDTYGSSTESTLVFLPGLSEITRLHHMLKGNEDHIDIIPLHSTISYQDQNRVFLRPKEGCRKVILATNLAESSITVKDVGFIIDFCLTKVLRKDNVTNFPSLKLQWSSKDKCTQRAGRTGRCCPGKVFRMVTLNFFKDLNQYAEPELLISPLELSVLRVKNFDMGQLISLFAVVMDPPPLNDIRNAVLELKQIGALSSTYQGKTSDLDGDLTELGKVISSLPIDVHLSKLIVMAHLLNVLEPAIIVAACLSTNRTVVRHFYEGRMQTYLDKLKWARGSDSDLIVSLEVYKEYTSFRERCERSQRNLEDFCNLKNLDEKKLFEVAALEQELRFRLEEMNIKSYDQPNRQINIAEDELMLKIAFCAAFYPNYLLTEDMDVETIDKSLAGLDPNKTVVLHNFPVNQVPLYRTQIVNQLTRRQISKDIEYIADCSRAMLILNDDEEMLIDSLESQVDLSYVTQPKNIPKKAVFKALKSTEIDSRICIAEYKEDAADARMKYYRDKIKQLEDQTVRKLLPSWTKIVVGRPADNSRLLTTHPEEYSYMTNANYFVEVEQNMAQDEHDNLEIQRLENFFMERQMADGSGKNAEYPIFKSELRILRGPTSPIQLSFRSVLDRSKGFKVDIDHMSVNSIILNPDYRKPRRQMMVAATVSQSKKNRVLACDTTLMPNIRGFPTLMSLLFAQYYRVIYNRELKSLVGAVFGLGWDADDKPIDKSYEVELGFDVQITQDDIFLINEARKTVSKLMRFTDVKDSGAPQLELQQLYRNILLTIIRRRRSIIEETSISSIIWDDANCVFIKDKHNVPVEQLSSLAPGEARPFLPLMEVTKKFSEMDMFHAIRENLDCLTMIEKCQEKPPASGISCFLCGFSNDNIFLIQSKIVEHLYSDAHIQKLEEFEKSEERARLRNEMS